MRMTKDRAKDILIHAGPEVLEQYAPVGVSLSECIDAALEVSVGHELDKIAEHFSLVRQDDFHLVGTLPVRQTETDEQLRNRIFSHFVLIKPKPNPSVHSHSWKLYQGFTDIYEYCETCDEKRRK
jgi:hypothetical protein